MNVIKKVLSAIWTVIKLILRAGLYILAGLFWFIGGLLKWHDKEAKRISASNKSHYEGYWERFLRQKNDR
ncbi:hypothetical protein P9911_029450 [Klebsiella oxytoca]|uniref:hypothetical protein n=1 Tax=Klebsiella oxytoca TaxID=571 RepID=UPI00254F8D41|nr:hypothetical protein [Klebsiella oxytoca]MEC5509931.1 hypothetical protein [Klebsiella oxytoca]